jgi:hypothetical protein
MPDARCIRGLVCKGQKKTHTSRQVQRRTSDIPCAMDLRLIRALPGVSGFLASVAFRKPTLRPGWAFAPPEDLTPTTEASGPHDFAVRFVTARQHAQDCSRSLSRPAIPSRARCRPRPPHPIPTFGDDGQRPFPRGRDDRSRKDDLPDGESEILPVGLICRRRGVPCVRNSLIENYTGAQFLYAKNS